MSHTNYAAKFEQTIIHQHVHLRQESQSHTAVHVLMRLYPIDKSFVYKVKEGRHVRIIIIAYIYVYMQCIIGVSSSSIEGEKKMSAQNYNSITFGINFQTYSSSYFFQISTIYTCLITGVMHILIFALRDKVTNRLESIVLNSGCDRMHVEYESKYFESIFPEAIPLVFLLPKTFQLLSFPIYFT